MTTNGGTTNTLPKFTGSSTIGDSAVAENSGKVGIGTTTPLGAFDVLGSGISTNNWIYLRGNVGTGAGTPSASATQGLMYGWNPSSGLGESQILYATGSGSGPRLDFGSWNGTTKTIEFSLNSGKAGIGTTAPLGALDVLGSGTSVGNWAYLRGNVGAGGGLPSASATQGLMFGWNASGGTGESQILYATGSGSGPRLDFGRWSGASKTIDVTLNNGYLGIGTTSPQYKLDVNGRIRTADGIVFPDGSLLRTGYLGTITGVVPASGSGLTGGGYSGTVSLGVDGTIARTDRNQTFQGVQTFITTATAFGAYFYNNNGGDVIRATCYNWNWNNGYCMKLDANAVLHLAGTMTNMPDFAESVAVSGDRKSYGPGDVIVIDTTGHQQFKLSDQPYSRLVAGIYSTKPGWIGTSHPMADLDGTEFQKEIPVAVVGIVPCKVTDENGPIFTGDLLVTSSTPGFAMRGTDTERLIGAVLGKALEPLDRGSGAIHVLVSLQ